MKITIENILEQYPKITATLPKELAEAEFKFIKDNIDLYRENDPDTKEIREYMDTFIFKLNKFLKGKDGDTDGEKIKQSDIPTGLKKLLPSSQLKVLVGSVELWDELERLKKLHKALPGLYKTEADYNKYKETIKQPVPYREFVQVQLHYFYGKTDHFILEWDGKDTLFGFTILNGDAEMAETGYISLSELKSLPFELDFYWKPKSLQAALHDADPDFFKKPGGKSTAKDENGAQTKIDEKIVKLLSTNQRKQVEKEGGAGLMDNVAKALETLPGYKSLVVGWDGYVMTTKNPINFGTWALAYLHFHTKDRHWFVIAHEDDDPDRLTVIEVDPKAGTDLTTAVDIKALHKAGAVLDLGFKPKSLQEAIHLTAPDKFMEPMILFEGNKAQRKLKIPAVVKKFLPKTALEELKKYKYAHGIIDRLERMTKQIPALGKSYEISSKCAKDYPGINEYNFQKVFFHYSWEGNEYYLLEWDKKGRVAVLVQTHGEYGDDIDRTWDLSMVIEQDSKMDLFWEVKTLQQALYQVAPDYHEKPLDDAKNKCLQDTGRSQVKQSEPKTTKKQSAQKPKDKKEEATIENIEHFTLEEKFLKRYMLLHGKTKTKSQILSFIKSLQKAIVEKQIRKTSKYAKEIETMQKELIRIYEMDENELVVNLDEKKLKSLKELFDKKKVRLSINYIKRFIGFYGSQDKEKAERLLGLIEKALANGKIPKNDPYHDRIVKIKKELKIFIDKEEVTISESELRGLAGVAGIKMPVFKRKKAFKDNECVSSMDLKKARFNYVGFTGRWKMMIGDPENPFHVMIYGAGGKGKSTFSVKFAKYLSDGLKLTTLYVADEEKVSGKLKDKLARFDAYNPELFITGELPNSLKGYDVVIIDSATSMGIRPEELESLQKKNPEVSFIYILQTNKQGSYFGQKKWEHLADVVMRFEDGMVTVEKTRFGETGEHRMDLWKETA